MVPWLRPNNKMLRYKPIVLLPRAFNWKTSHLELKASATLLCDMSTCHTRPIVPAGQRHQVFYTTHGLSHPSVRTTRKLISVCGVVSRNKWGFGPNSVSHANLPKSRHTSKPHLRISASLNASSIIFIQIFYMGSLPPSNSFTHLLTVVGQFCDWPEATPLNDTTTSYQLCISFSQSSIGLLVLASQLTCHPTRNPSSLHNYGNQSHSCWVLSSVSQIQLSDQIFCSEYCNKSNYSNKINFWRSNRMEYINNFFLERWGCLNNQRNCRSIIAIQTKLISGVQIVWNTLTIFFL